VSRGYDAGFPLFRTVIESDRAIRCPTTKICKLRAHNSQDCTECANCDLSKRTYAISVLYDDDDEGHRWLAAAGVLSPKPFTIVVGGKKFLALADLRNGLCADCLRQQPNYVSLMESTKRRMVTLTNFVIVHGVSMKISPFSGLLEVAFE